ncbi:MAG TPA: sugar transferase [Bacteroidales bacterium]|nr:sugar transferase [Bacteroidales bacterium]
MNDRKRILRYVLLDYVSAFFAWQLFDVFRFFTFRHTIQFPNLTEFMTAEKALWMSVLIPALWVVIYHFSGYYATPRRKTNLGDLLSTGVSTFFGVLFLFFLIIINDYPEYPALYYEIMGGFFLIHVVCTTLTRFLQTNSLIRKQAKGIDCIPVFVIGTGKNALRIRREFNQYKSSFCYKLVGFIRTGQVRDEVSADEICGNMEELLPLMTANRVEEIIFALDDTHPTNTGKLLNSVYHLHVPVKAYASRQDMLAGSVSLFSLFGIPLVNLTPAAMPMWQQKIKALLDKTFSLIVLVLLSPFFLFLSIRVRLDSPGKVFYAQERLGKAGKPFRIYKFRTMFTNAEPDGPQLSNINDSRVTPFGRFMRKYRLDEIPQFWNVIKGDMSLVGPRPERRHFVELIVRKAPQYYLTQQVLPGITSWGMVKYGYADSVEKMIQRLEYDIIYLENQSLLLDLKILVFTIKPLLRGKGQ